MRLLDPFSFTRQLSTVPPLSSLLLIILQSTESSEERSIGILGRSGTSCRAPQKREFAVTDTVLSKIP